MTIDAATAVNRLIPHRIPVKEEARAFAPSNIALCKYWGKRDEELKLPVTGSLSVSLGTLGTRTTLRTAQQDQLIIDGRIYSADEKPYRRFFRFLDLFRGPGSGFAVESVNTIPMAAGLASSASGFAAAVRALDQLYGWTLPPRDLSMLARIGSGSASRSVYAGFVEWHAGTDPDGTDSFAERLDVDWPEFRIGILELTAAEKPVGSGEGMRRTRDTSALYAAWPDEVARALPRIRAAVRPRDLPALGAAAEQNALAMHATMISAWPPILYWLPESVAALHAVQKLRADGVQVYATMDAGPNVKLIFTEEVQDQVRDRFPHLQVVSPFTG